MVQQRFEEYRDGAVVRVWFEEVPDELPPTLDLVTLADELARQVATVNSLLDAVDELILNALMEA